MSEPTSIFTWNDGGVPAPYEGQPDFPNWALLPKQGYILDLNDVSEDNRYMCRALWRLHDNRCLYRDVTGLRRWVIAGTWP